MPFQILVAIEHPTREVPRPTKIQQADSFRTLDCVMLEPEARAGVGTVQEFATALVERFQPPDAPTDKARDQPRVRAVLAHVRDQLGSREVPLLEAIIDYWNPVSGLIQRQEHGVQKQGDALRWKDGRRVAFQTAVVMFEIDHSLDSLV